MKSKINLKLSKIDNFVKELFLKKVIINATRLLFIEMRSFEFRMSETAEL